MTDNPTPAPIRDVIERLERAEGACRELDGEIGLALGLFVEREYRDQMVLVQIRPDGGLNYPGNGDRHMLVRDYTASIDAALTLVPKSLSWCIKGPQFQSAERHSRAFLESGDYEWRGEGPTPAIALTLAALRAILAAGDGGRS